MPAALPAPRLEPFSPAMRRPIARAATVTRGERAQRNVVRLVLVVYLLAIFEGALRKWLFPGFSQYLFFVRDPFVLCAYAIATKDRLWPSNSIPLKAAFGAGLMGMLIALLQLATNGFDGTEALLAVYGWRNYFFYMPLAFLIGAQFRRADVYRFLRITLLVAAPMAILVVLQFRAPIGAPINVGNAADTLSQFRGLGLDPDHTRPMGTYTSVNGEAMFLSSAFAALLALILTPARGRPIGWVILILGTAGVLTGLAFSGSRYAFLHCGLAVVGAMALGLVGRGSALKVRALFLPGVLLTLVVTLYPIVFPSAFQSIASRWSSADAVESQQFRGGVFGRALAGMIDFVPLLQVAPPLGYGLGYGGNASTTLGATIGGVLPLELAESDWARHIVDLGPMFGTAFIVFRIWLTLWVARAVWRSTRSNSDPLPVLLFAFFGFELLYGQVTGHGTINVYTWLFMGLCLASMRRNTPRAKRVARRRPAWRDRESFALKV